MSYQNPYGQPQDPYRPDPPAGGFPSYGAPQDGYQRYGSPQGYSAPQPYGQGPQFQGPPPTNTLAIIALVGSFFVSLVGVICGHIALGQIRRTGEGGRGLAIAGLVIGYLGIFFWVIYVFIVVVAAIAVY